MKKNAIEDLATLTTIPYNTLQKLFYRLGTIIAYDVQESLKEKEKISSIDIGIGSLNVLCTEDNISYKFIPNNTLEQDVVEGVTYSNLRLVSDIENSLRNKIMSTYKDLI